MPRAGNMGMVADCHRQITDGWLESDGCLRVVTRFSRSQREAKKVVRRWLAKVS
ncbi:hypothetical protein ACLOJK_004728 [Asimina triloba]